MMTDFALFNQCTIHAVYLIWSCTCPSIVTHMPIYSPPQGAQRLSGRVLDWRPRGRGFEPHRCQCVVSLSKNINPSLVLVQPRKTDPFITERLLMARKESNQTKTVHLKAAISPFSLKRQVNPHNPQFFLSQITFVSPVHSSFSYVTVPLLFNGWGRV